MWLKELGFHITIAQLEQKTLFQNQQSMNYTIAFSGWGADIPDPVSYLGTMVTGGGNNWAGWSNRQFDHLVDEAANEGDNARRYEYFQQAEAILLREAPLIPLYFQSQTYAVNPAVHGWTMNVVGTHELEKVWLEK
jgi:oligopeptide transport system substrate-binding protein